jgi:iron(III) transport system ATP-binding protein
MANAIFEVCMINHLVKRKTDQLSGGERQRIAIAQLLIRSPKLLLLDEPYSNLDLIHKNILKDVIREIGENLQISCLLVSHDPTDILPWANEVMLMQHGKIVQSGAPEHVYQHPTNAYTAALLGKYQILPLHIADLLLPYSGTAPVGKKIFVRPGNFKITSEDHGVAAQVISVEFMVGFYELELIVEDTIVYIHTLNRHVQKGEVIFIALDAKTIQFIG